MPTIITHGVVGLGAAKVYTSLTGREMPKKFWAFSALCPMIPDLDGLGYWIGIPYDHVFGHRGFSHSLCFAFLLAVLVAEIFFGEKARFSRKTWGLGFYFFLIITSHGLLDGLTNGGLGMAYFSPLDLHRYFLPWRPIEVAPLSLSRFFSARGAEVMISEFKWVWIPTLVAVGVAKIFGKKPVNREH